MSDQGYNIWGVVGSVLGVLTTFQGILILLDRLLPLRALRTFDDTVKETKELLRSAKEDDELFRSCEHAFDTAEATLKQ